MNSKLSRKSITSLSFGLGEGFGLGAGLGGVVLLGGVTVEGGGLDVDVFFEFFSGVTVTLGLQKQRVPLNKQTSFDTK